MRMTRCLFGIDIEALEQELLRREERHQAELTALTNRLDLVLSSNAQLRQGLDLLNADRAAIQAIITHSNGVIDQEVRSLTPRGGRRRRAERLGRVLWGVPVSEMERTFSAQEHDCTIEINRVQSQLNLALVNHLSLRQELEMLNPRLATCEHTSQIHTAKPIELQSARIRDHVSDLPPPLSAEFAH
jgi:hypothetical protein